VTREVIIAKGLAAVAGAVFACDQGGDAVHVSGMVALDADGKTVGIGDCTAQTRTGARADQGDTRAAGATLADIAHTTFVSRTSPTMRR